MTIFPTLLIEQAMIGLPPLGHYNCRNIEGENGQQDNYANGDEKIGQLHLALTAFQRFRPIQTSPVHLSKSKGVKIGKCKYKFLNLHCPADRSTHFHRLSFPC